MKYAISACLCGVNCKYCGGNNLDVRLKKLFDEGKAILICPECLGGLDVPRCPGERINGIIVNSNGDDVTDPYTRGAYIALEVLKENGIKKAILKDLSPSCGVDYIYDGSFSHKVIDGMGITTEVFVSHGIEVISEKKYEEE